ncbi:MAG TPA: ScpA family protein [Gammaproteobacteria bacterium]|jgi:segregation and condensation protein A|nr:ScpA family protein [Gammaproteobacteria bacterium]
MSESTGPETTPAVHPQEQLPLAIVQGEAVAELPADLYIPPDALKVFLEAFEGPLDLLLYLIRKQNIDVTDIPVADITRQYVEYIELMQDMQLELAGEYLVMSATLAEIKSRMLLPRPAGDVEDEDDPRAELVRRLQEYERYKQAAEDIDELPRLGRDVFQAEAEAPEQKVIQLPPEVDLQDLIAAFQEVMKRASMYAHHHVQLEALSVRERMSIVLSRVSSDRFTPFTDLFTAEEGRMGVVVTFLAILELVKESLLDLTQSEPYAPIHVKAATGSQDAAVPEPVDQVTA